MYKLLIGLLVLLISGCQHWTVPETSRTGKVHSVRFGMSEISLSELRVNVGDEILFYNDRTNLVRLVILEGGRNLACQRGFSGYADQEALISPGGTASFCFDKAGTARYILRSKPGEKPLSAQILIRDGSPTHGQEGASRPDSPIEMPQTREVNESSSVPKSK